MTCWEYLREDTWLGYNYYTPEVEVVFSAADGSPRRMIMEVDSGAAISLLPRSAADILMLNYDLGIPISLGGVGGSVFVARVFELDASVGEENVRIPVAIAPTEGFPPLLGRLGLYDQKSVLMDNENKMTCVGAITAPEPSPRYLVPSELVWSVLIFGFILIALWR